MHSMSWLGRTLLLSHLERLDDVVHLDVLVRAEVDAALEALAHVGDVVLEAPKSRDGQVVRHHGAVANESSFRVALDFAGLHEATGDRAELRGLEDLAHFCR